MNNIYGLLSSIIDNYGATATSIATINDNCMADRKLVNAPSAISVGLTVSRF